MAMKPQKVPRVKLGNGCLADEFPHEYGCLCSNCETVWQRLLDEDKKQNGNET